MLAVRERMLRWMLRVRGPEAQPITLVQKRIYVLPTRAGLGMLLTLLLMLIGSINYNLSLGYALTFLLGAVGVAHILFSWRTLLGLKLHFRTIDEAFAGGVAALQVQLANDGDQTRHGLSLALADGHPLLTQVDLPSRSSTTFSAAWPVMQRGWQRPGRIAVETRFPLGWVRAWSYIEPDARQLVMPQPLGDWPLPSGLGSEGNRLNNAAGNDDFHGLRTQQRGDPIGRIAWKTLAQRGTPLVKQFVGGEREALTLDWYALPADMTLEERLSQLTQWVLMARQAARPLCLQLPTASLGPAADPSHYSACLEKLALFETAPGT